MKLIPRQIAQPSVLLSLLLLMLVEFVRNALILSILPNLSVSAFTLSTATIGLAISAHYLFDNILRTPMGIFIDHFGHRIMLSGGLFVAAVGLLIITSATSAVSIIVGAAVLGIGTSPLWPAVISLVTAHSAVGDRASAMGYIYTAWLVGGGAGPIVINFLVGTSYRLAFLVLLVILLGCGILAYLNSPSAPDPLHAKARLEFDFHSYLREMVRHLKEIRVLFPGMFVQTFAIGVMIPVLTPYARVVLDVTPQMQSAAIIIVGGATVLLLPIMGRLVDRIGARPFLSGGFILASIALVFFSMQKSIWPATLFLLMLSLAYSMILPSWNSVLDASINRQKRAAMWGMFMTIEGLGTATGPLIGGRLWDSISPQAPFVLSASVLGTMGLLYAFLRIPGLRRNLRTNSRVS